MRGGGITRNGNREWEWALREGRNGNGRTRNGSLPLTACWGLALKCYKLRTRQHKMLNINVLRPLKHYFPKDLMNFGRRL
jgi:hypothetical protein